MKKLRKEEKQKHIGLSVKAFILLFLFAIIVLIIPSIIRFYTNTNILPGDESYLNLRLAENILSKKSISNDDLSYSGRNAFYPIGWPAFLAIFSFIFKIPVITSSKILPFLLTLISFILFYFILNKLNLPNNIKIISSILLIISPGFLYLSFISTRFSAVIFLSLLSFFLLLQENKIYLFLATITLALMTFFSLPSSIVILSLILVYMKFENIKKMRWFWLTLILFFVVSLIYYGKILINFGIPELLKFTVEETGSNSELKSFISGLGGKFGLTIFSIILFFFGLNFLWRQKYKHFSIYFSILILFILSIYFEWVLLYLNFFVTIITAIGLIWVKELRWYSNIIKTLTIIILIIGLIFSYGSYTYRLATELPNKEIVIGLNELNKISNNKDVIFSHYSRGYWINTIAKRKNIMDANFLYAPDINQRWIDSNIIIESSDVNQTIPLIEKYNIKYIFLDKDLKDEILPEKEKKLLFLLKFSKENFEKVYSNEKVEIYKYIK